MNKNSIDDKNVYVSNNNLGTFFVLFLKNNR